MKVPAVGNRIVVLTLRAVRSWMGLLGLRSSRS